MNNFKFQKRDVEKRSAGSAPSTRKGGKADMAVDVFQIFHAEKNHRETLAQNRELADETAAQLDVIHEQTLMAHREEAWKNRAALLSGLQTISDSIHHLSNHEKINTIDRISQYLNPLFFDENASEQVEIKILSDYFDGDGQLGFEDMASTSAWWESQMHLNQEDSLEKIEGKILGTKMLLTYWICKYFIYHANQP